MIDFVTSPTRYALYHRQALLLRCSHATVGDVWQGDIFQRDAECAEAVAELSNVKNGD